MNTVKSQVAAIVLVTQMPGISWSADVVSDLEINARQVYERQLLEFIGPIQGRDQRSILMDPQRAPIYWTSKGSSRDLDVCEFADTLASDSTYYQPTGSRFYGSYHSFILSLNLTSPKLPDSEVESVAQDVNRNSALTKSGVEDTASLHGSIQKFTSLLPSYSRSSVAAIERALDPAALRLMPARDGTTRQCASYSVSPGVDSLKLANLTAVWNDTRSKSDLVGTKASGASASSSTSRTEVSVTAVVGRLSVLPGPWFSKLLVNTYATDGPFVASAPKDSWYGRNGKPSWFVREVIVAQSIQVHLTLPYGIYSQYKRRFGAGDSITFGPIKSGKGGLATPIVASFNDEKGEIKLVQENRDLLVLAIVAERLGR